MEEQMVLPYDLFRQSWVLGRLAIRESLQWEQRRLLEQAAVLGRKQ